MDGARWTSGAIEAYIDPISNFFSRRYVQKCDAINDFETMVDGS